MSPQSSRLIIECPNIQQVFTEDEILALSRKAISRQFRKGELIFEEGTICRGFYFITDGKARIYQNGPFGKDSLICILSRNDFFCMGSMLAETASSYSASALEDVAVNFIPREAFMEIYERSSTLRNNVLLALIHEQTILINKLTVLAQYPVKQKVAASLIMLRAVFAKSTPAQPNVITISRDDLASFTGIATESVVRALRVLKDEQIITTKGAKINIQKPEALFSIIDECHTLRNEEQPMS